MSKSLPTTNLPTLTVVDANVLQSLFDKIDQLSEKIETLSRDGDGYLNQNETATFIGVHRDTIKKWANQNTIKYTSIGDTKRFRKSDVVAVMDKFANR